MAVLSPGTARGAPSPPVWPAPDLVDGVRDLLTGFYGQQATAGAPYFLRAPEWDMDKAPSSKDPDTLWELYGGPGTACHSAATDSQFIDCAGRRLARSLGWTYYGGLPLFDASRGYYANEALINLAAYYALYHAFVHDFDAPVDAAYTPGPGPGIRGNKRYHRSMVQAYEVHMRDALVRLMRDTRADPVMQADLTRSVGALTTGYVRTVQAVQELGAWASPQDRSDALALVAGLVQRAWWEWMAPQPEGPRTAGFAALGSDSYYASAVAGDPAWAGTDYFVVAGEAVPSLRPAYLTGGPFGGLWFDADYAIPGEWYCHSRFAPGSTEFQACLDAAARAGPGGTKSPFGQYYGATSCLDRAPPGVVTPYSCGPTNMGSIAEEWLWTHVGARLGAALLAGLAPLPPSDPNARPRRIGALAYDAITARLGYGVSGWHGGAGEHDDMEWALHPDGNVRAIRSLSGGRHDGEAQDGRTSLGEMDSLPGASGVAGDMWPVDRQEYPGGIENHVPGPNSLYAGLLFAYVLADKPAAGLSPSLFDTQYRNNVGEFGPWVWLMQSAFNRCPDVPGADDPADGSCFAFDIGLFPNPATVRRVPLTVAADDPSPAAFRYLWRDPGSGLAADAVADAQATCRGEGGIPWRRLYDRDTAGSSPYLVDEGGFGAFNEQVQSYGGFMRLAAARYPLAAPDPGEQGDFDVWRTDVLAPWYAMAHDQVAAILDLYANDYGFIPDVENSACVGTDPAPGNSASTVHAWQYGTWDSASAVTVRRAMWYSVAALWYWQYDTDWLDIDPAAW